MRKKFSFVILYATLFRFVAHFARIRIEDSSLNRFALNGIQRDFLGGDFIRLPLLSYTNCYTNHSVKGRMVFIQSGLVATWWSRNVVVAGEIHSRAWMPKERERSYFIFDSCQKRDVSSYSLHYQQSQPASIC